MKKIFAVGIAAMLALSLAACSGGSGDGGGAATTDATAAGTSFQVMSSSFNLVTPILAQVMGGAGAQVVKESTNDPVCTANADTYTCTATGEQGGTATLTGTADEDTLTFSFTAIFDNFRPDADTTLDGSFLWTFTIDQGYLDMYSSVKSSPFKCSASKTDEEADRCDYSEENIDGEGYCAETDQVCSANSANHLMNFTFTIGADGFIYTDVCGTFTYGPNTTMSMDYCSDDIEAATSLFSASIDGTFNGTAVDESFNALCDFSSVE